MVIDKEKMTDEFRKILRMPSDFIVSEEVDDLAELVNEELKEFLRGY